MKELVDQIQARLRDQKITVEDVDIESRLKKLILDFRVPEGEARRSVLNYFLKEHGIMPQARASSEKVRVGEIKEAGRWVATAGQGPRPLGAGWSLPSHKWDSWATARVHEVCEVG